jgi:hypothetical protein
MNGDGWTSVDRCWWMDVCGRTSVDKCWWAEGAKWTELDKTGRASNEIVMDDDGDERQR